MRNEITNVIYSLFSTNSNLFPILQAYPMYKAYFHFSDVKSSYTEITSIF